MMSELKILNDACLVAEKDRVHIRQEHSQKNYITGRQVEESDENKSERNVDSGINSVKKEMKSQ